MGLLTTHVLDIAAGCPASGLVVQLFAMSDGEMESIDRQITNSDGRCSNPLLEKDSFKKCKEELNIPFELLHLDELNSELEKFIDNAPCVIGKNDNVFSIIITSEELEKCQSNVESFSNLLDSKINPP